MRGKQTFKISQKNLFSIFNFQFSIFTVTTSMTETGNPKPNAGSSCGERRTRRCSKYIVPGTLVKMRDSKITHNRSSTQISSSAISLTPSSTFQHDPSSLNQDNGVPCFHLPMYHSQPSCFNRKKLFAVTPVFTPTQTYQFQKQLEIQVNFVSFIMNFTHVLVGDMFKK